MLLSLMTSSLHKYFPVLISTLFWQIHLPCSFCYGSEAFRRKVNGIEFGNLTVVFNSSSASKDLSAFPFTYIVYDTYTNDGTFLVSTTSTIFNFNPRNSSLEYLTGTKPFLRRQFGDRAVTLYQNIRGIIQSPTAPHRIWVVDADRQCITYYDRKLSSYGDITGGCDKDDSADGRIKSSMFGSTSELVSHPERENELYLYDNTHHVIRRIFYNTETSEWMVKAEGNFEVNARGFAVDATGGKFYISVENGVWWYRQAPYERKHLFTGKTGYEDGSLQNATVDHPTSMLFLSDDTFIMADTKNNKLRVVDMRGEKISSICSRPNGTFTQVVEGNIEACRIRAPVSMARQGTGKKILIVGGADIYQLEFSGEINSATLPITTQINGGINDSAVDNSSTDALTGNYGNWFKENDHVIYITAGISGVIVVALSSFCLTGRKRRQPEGNQLSVSASLSARQSQIYPPSLRKSQMYSPSPSFISSIQQSQISVPGIRQTQSFVPFNRQLSISAPNSAHNAGQLEGQKRKPKYNSKLRKKGKHR